MKRIGIIFGGANNEHEVSCNSARSVASHLDLLRFEPVLIGIDRRGGWHRVDSVDALADVTEGSRFPDLDGIDVAFPALHGRFGEDGTVQGLLELARLPYVGCGVLSSALAMDKLLTQRLLELVGIPTIPTSAVIAATVGDAVMLADALGYPIFVKPNRSGSSVGASRVESAEAVADAIALALQHDSTALLQETIVGDEVAIGVLQHLDGSLAVGAPLRIVTGDTAIFFDYTAKYTAEGGATLEVPAQIPDAAQARLVELATLAFRTLGCEGLARVDFFLGADGTITLNEVNTLPGLTALSQYPRMWQAVGVSYTELLSRLIDRAVIAFSGERSVVAIAASAPGVSAREGSI
ncbi:D-alanine--D-alanine ligase family protein [Frigoribacterium sp. CG_9.8]|uniref:D-alanine--D-alanine ligase family protein n=1 Tax=Frigoribacterium sp. CG_9.8 TaxID=2787733 RepID=UPI0018CAAE2B|nr:D-alanine--D-alanine ligase family protein [Frigoribacterium sp. CG_9.8]MBG6107351.1 D-alanine-D-alanine ligase [Frigoribacterium sp. CG_9.8]